MNCIFSNKNPFPHIKWWNIIWTEEVLSEDPYGARHLGLLSIYIKFAPGRQFGLKAQYFSDSQLETKSTSYPTWPLPDPTHLRKAEVTPVGMGGDWLSVTPVQGLSF